MPGALKEARLAEVARYETAYRNSAYRLGARRRLHIERHLARIPKGRDRKSVV
jgi:hypothetical protein